MEKKQISQPSNNWLQSFKPYDPKIKTQLSKVEEQLRSEKQWRANEIKVQKKWISKSK